MSPASEGRRRGLYVLLGVVLLVAVGALWLPRWWEMRVYRQQEKIAGVEAPVLPGQLTDQRKKIDPGKRATDVLAAIGRPSMEAETSGTSSHGIWTYYYTDGTMVVNLTDGIVARISTSYGPPRIPTSRRK